MAALNRFDVVLEQYLDNYMRKMYSILPCEVIAVDYDVPSVDVKPLFYDVAPNGDTIKIADSFDVPLFVYSAAKGNLCISMPVKVGDKVAGIFSDGDTSNIMVQGSDEQPVRFARRKDMYPLMVIPSFYTQSQPCPIDPDNIVIKHGSQKITVKSDKTIFDGPCEFNNETKFKSTVNIIGATTLESTLDTGGKITAPNATIGGTNIP